MDYTWSIEERDLAICRCWQRSSARRASYGVHYVDVGEEHPTFKGSSDVPAAGLSV